MSVATQLVGLLTGTKLPRGATFRPGDIIELETANGRLVRGRVADVGRGAVRLEARHSLLIRYEDLVRWRPGEGLGELGNFHGAKPADDGPAWRTL